MDIAAVISNDATKEKTGIFFPSMFPTLSIVDPDLMMSVPPKFTAYQGMDAFFHASESVINKNEHVVAEMFALKAIELIAEYLPIAYKDGNNKEASYYMAIANTLASYYMNCISAHTMELVMGSYHEEPMIKMARAMGVEKPTSGKDFIRALDALLESIDCADLKMSEAGITREEMKLYPQRVHEVLGGDITADPLPLSDEDYLEIYEKSFR